MSFVFIIFIKKMFEAIITDYKLFLFILSVSSGYVNSLKLR